MSAIHLLLPDEVREYIEEQVRAGHFQSAGEMITALVEDARARIASKELCAFLDEGESSEAVESTDEEWRQEIASMKAKVLKGSQR